MNYKFAFGDESGSLSSKSGQGITTHLVTALLLTNSVEEVRQSISKFKQTKEMREESEISFNSSSRENRISFLKDFLPSECSVHAVVIDERTTQLYGFDLYLYAWTQLLKWVALSTLDRAKVYLDEYGNPATTIPALMRSMRHNAGLHIPSPYFASLLRAVRSHTEPAIQAADIVAGAVFQLVEKGDAAYYQILRARAQIWRPVENENPPS